MVRRTVTLPEAIDALVRDHAVEGESFSACAARLILEGARKRGSKKPPSYVGSGSGSRDLSQKVERYLRDPVLMSR